MALAFFSGTLGRGLRGAALLFPDLRILRLSLLFGVDTRCSLLRLLCGLVRHKP